MSGNTKKAIQELVLGRELTNQLRDLLTKSFTDEEEASLVDVISEDLVTKIRNTFANTLSILRNNGDYYNDYDDNEVIANTSSDGRKSEDSSESIKSTPPPTLKGRRGSKKTWKCVESRKKITSALIDDGYAWRKYGQKQILNSNHPRSYYRCTHKTEQLCQATKQVQQTVDDPLPKFETIYYGHHTCNNILKTTCDQFFMDHSSTCDDSSVILNFANNNFTNKLQDNPFSPSVKKESKEEEDYKPITYNGSSSSTDYIFAPHEDRLTAFNFPSVLSADDHDVISGVVDSVDLDDFCFSFEGDS